MWFVFLAGAVGFFVFDVYRIFSYKIETGYLFITFKNLKGISSHFIVYIAAGLLGVFVNIDVIISNLHIDNNEIRGLSGAIIRSFALGALGPAGLKKVESSKGVRSRNDRAVSVEDTQVTGASFADYVRFFLMR